MPRRSPFTAVPSRLAQLEQPLRADLHCHSTASDGDYTPSQVVALARNARLAAVAITDHDTLAGLPEARQFAESHIELIAGVEISAAFGTGEVHLLGYFLDPDHEELNAVLGQMCQRRRERFHDFVTQLAATGAPLSVDRVQRAAAVSPSLGRRHLASLLIASGRASNNREAFHRYLIPLNERVLPKMLLPLDEAIQLVHTDGGVASLAHPPANLSIEAVQQLAEAGLDALETNYPWGRSSPGVRLRELARQFGLAITGGSDCHGPEPSHRRIGSHGIRLEELTALRERRDHRDCPGS